MEHRVIPGRITHGLSLTLALLLAVSLLGTSAGLLAGCGEESSLAVTYFITDWDDLQKAFDSANNGDVIDLSALWSPATQMSFKVPANLELALVGHQNVTFTGVAMTFGGANKLSITNLSLQSTNNQAASTLNFSGKANELIISGRNLLSVAPAAVTSGNGAAIGVADGVELTISGSGSLTAIGNNGGASIGGGSGKAGGSITIEVAEGSRLVVNGSNGGAGIGGGDGGAGGDITIMGGAITVYADSSDISGSIAISRPGVDAASLAASSGAGIGGGAGAGNGNITINGGNVTVFSNSESAAIGGGKGGAGGSITVTAGSVSAINRGNGPGIGGGTDGEGGTVAISGGSISTSGKLQAINGSVESLPAAYYWWANNAAEINAEDLNAYPGSPFVSRDVFRFVRIEASEVRAVSVSPDAVTVIRGNTQQFNATVSAAGGAGTECNWTISGNTSRNSTIGTDGVLTVAPDEVSSTIIVTATSIADNTVSGTATVTVIAGE